MSDPFSRDWFSSPDQPDPMRAAQGGMKPALPKRFYKEAGVEERDGAFHLVLDGRPARTPARQPLAVPSRALAEALAEEWGRQGETIDPAAMPVTRIVNSTIDGVSALRQEVVDDLVRYAGSDLVFYRGEGPERLVAAQNAAWTPVLEWARERHGARFALAEGVMFVDQPESATTAVRAAIEAIRSPFALAALHVMTTLTGSVLISLAQTAGALGPAEAWDAAHVDERYQESVWGEDHEALARREKRRAEFEAAAAVFRLSEG